MKDGFIKAALINMSSGNGAIAANAARIIDCAGIAASKGAKIIVTPRLSLSGADLRDLAGNEDLLNAQRSALIEIAKKTKSLDAIIFVGLYILTEERFYDCVCALSKGEILGFTPSEECDDSVVIGGNEIPISDMVYTSSAIPGLSLRVEIGETKGSLPYGAYPATVIVNPTAIFEYAGRLNALKTLMEARASREKCAIINVNMGPGGSSTDGIYLGGAIAASENGILEATNGNESLMGETRITMADIDINALVKLRAKDPAFKEKETFDSVFCEFNLKIEVTKLSPISRHPFYPEDELLRELFCREVFEIQTRALMERLSHIGLKKVVLGVSGGLDSTLALLVAANALNCLGSEKTDLIAVTLPGFGTTDRTYENAVGMINSLGADFREISIVDAVNVHFKDIGQPEGTYDLTFENAQARERTQILMDLAGRENALMIGTGDMSEIALGWCTYNGDHMSMYGVNPGVPKTLIREIVTYYAKGCKSKKLSAHLLDVVATPVSPELVPSKGGEIEQKTESNVGPYELSDFFLYYTLKYGFGKEKIFRLACLAFSGDYSKDEIKKWLDVFFKRFISQAFKRSCSVDGPAVLPWSLSPRTGFKMPSDGSGACFS